MNAIFMLMANRMDEQQMALIRAAYEFTREAHEDVFGGRVATCHRQHKTNQKYRRGYEVEH